MDPKKKKDIRALLNTLFMIGFVVAFVIYFAIPDNRTPFLIVCGVSIAIKVVDYIIRFFVR